MGGNFITLPWKWWCCRRNPSFLHQRKPLQDNLWKSRWWRSLPLETFLGCLPQNNLGWRNSYCQFWSSLWKQGRTTDLHCWSLLAKRRRNRDSWIGIQTTPRTVHLGLAQRNFLSFLDPPFPHVTVWSLDLLFSIVHFAPLVTDLPLTFTLAISFLTDVYRYTIQ